MNYPEFPAEIQQQIEDDIISGNLPLKHILQIQELKEKYGSSSEEFDWVISSLYRKGLIELIDSERIRIFGLPSAEIESVFQFAEKSKLKPSTVVRKVEVFPSDEYIAKKLEIKAGNPVFVQVRTRLINDHVLANQYNFIPYEICPGLEWIDLSSSSFQVTLEKKFHTVITQINEEYELKTPIRDDAEILQVPKNEMLLVVQRTSFSRNKIPVVFADIHVKPDQFHYVKDLWPKALPLLDLHNKEMK